MPMQGSFQNRMAERAVIGQPSPEAGMGATELLYSDRHAGTITHVEGKRLWFARDIATRTDSNERSDAQSYTYARDPKAGEVIYTLRRNGRWVRIGQGATDGTSLRIGYRDEHYDFGF